MRGVGEGSRTGCVFRRRSGWRCLFSGHLSGRPRRHSLRLHCPSAIHKVMHKNPGQVHEAGDLNGAHATVQ